VALSPDGKTLAVGTSKGAIFLRDAVSGKELGKLEGIKGAVQCVAFSLDGKKIAAGGADKKVHIWDLAVNKQVKEFGEHSAGVTRVVFSPDGQTLASASDDPIIYLWELGSGNELHQLTEHQGTADSVAFSPDGKLLATGSHQDGSARIWETASGNLLHHLPGQPGYVQAVLFSPDGKTLAVGSWRNVRLHEVATGVERGRLPGHQGDVAAFAFSPDGRRLVSGGGDTTALVWDLTGKAPADPFAAAKPSEVELKKAWTELAGEDGNKAYRALWTLVTAADEAVLFLQKQLQPQAPVDPKRIAKWIADLDDDEFTVRDKATAELEKLGDLAEPALRKALEEMPSPEVTQRVNQLLAKLHGQATSGTWIQKLRAIEVLEHIGTAQAKQVLEVLQKGSPEAKLTQEAKAALARLAARSAASP
jgi:dipeptidyl aminopeptidase/acylaminoacyl peptidase